MSYSLGNLPLAYALMVIPLFASGVLWLGVFLRRASYRRRFQGWRLVWEMWLSSLLLTAALFGVMYWYLFWQSFYSVTIQSDGGWSLQYAVPARTVVLVPAQIQMLDVQPDWLSIPSARRRVVLRIQLQSGQSFTSAPLPRSEAEQLIQQLNRQLTAAVSASISVSSSSNSFHGSCRT